MMQRRIAVFFYGLFMDPEALRAKGIDPTDPRRGSVPGLSLRIGRRAALVADPAGRAHGIVMDLTHADIDRLYAEPGVSMYRAEAVTIELEDRTSCAALCFNLPAAPLDEEFNAEYANKLRDVARRMGAS